MSKPRILVVVEGGVIQNVVSDLPIELHVIDHDRVQDETLLQYAGEPDAVSPEAYEQAIAEARLREDEHVEKRSAAPAV